MNSFPWITLISKEALENYETGVLGYPALHIIVQSIIRTKYLKPMKQSMSQTRFVENPKKSRTAVDTELVIGVSFNYKG